MTTDSQIQELLKNKNQGVKIDLGCGEDKAGPDWIGVDYRDIPGVVDVVWDLERFPYPFPDECASIVLTSHVVEHLNPHGGDSRILGLLNLLLDKKIINASEIAGYIGEMDPGPRFMRFMDEVWRILCPGGQFALTFPYAASKGFFQDPTHINPINERTFAYFDPLEPRSNGVLYSIYKPKPWKIEFSAYSVVGNMEVKLVKRKEDPSYGQESIQGPKETR